MQRLPEADRAVVDIRKLTDYVLDPDHHRGQHKARVFRAALGIGRNDAEWLRERLLLAARTSKALLKRQDEFGALYEIDFVLVGVEKEITIRSSWIIRSHETFPRFVSWLQLIDAKAS